MFVVYNLTYKTCTCSEFFVSVGPILSTYVDTAVLPYPQLVVGQALHVSEELQPLVAVALDDDLAPVGVGVIHRVVGAVGVRADAVVLLA